MRAWDEPDPPAEVLAAQARAVEAADRAFFRADIMLAACLASVASAYYLHPAAYLIAAFFWVDGWLILRRV